MEAPARLGRPSAEPLAGRGHKSRSAWARWEVGLTGALGVVAVLAGTGSMVACDPVLRGLEAGSALDRTIDRNFGRGRQIVDRRVLKVVLTWDRAADIDLHVTEPSGEKCWYQNQTTRSGGRLDRDDTSSRGPETYTSALPVPRGTYRIGVVYYRGSGPVTATVRIHPPFQQPSVRRIRLPRADRTTLHRVARLTIR